MPKAKPARFGRAEAQSLIRTTRETIQRRVLAVDLDDWTRRAGIAFDGRGTQGLRSVLEALLHSILVATETHEEESWMRRGLIESVSHGEVVIRDVESWRQYLAPVPSNAAIHSRVLFDIGEQTRRGWMAAACIVTSRPVPVLATLRRSCGMVFCTDAVNATWLKMKKLAAPANCESCRRQRRIERPGRGGIA